MLMGTYNAAIHKMNVPINLAAFIGKTLYFGQDALPDACQLPAAEAAVDGLPGAVATGQVTPGDACANLPQHRVEKLSVADLRRATHPALQQRPKDLPFFVA